MEREDKAQALAERSETGKERDDVADEDETAVCYAVRSASKGRALSVGVGA